MADRQSYLDPARRSEGEKAERDRSIYYRWHLVLLHKQIFAGFRDHPRFVALVEKIQRELGRQRERLESAKN